MTSQSLHNLDYEMINEIFEPIRNRVTSEIKLYTNENISFQISPSDLQNTKVSMINITNICMQYSCFQKLPLTSSIFRNKY